MALRFAPSRGAGALTLNALTRGPQGLAATLSVGTVTTLNPGATPTVSNTGNTSAAVFAFGIPTSKTVTVGTTTTGAEGTSASVSDSGSATASVFDFTIPRGASPAVGYTFSTTTTDSDPGNGIVRFNNATPASVTTIYFDNLDADGNTVTAWLDTMDDSTDTSKGFLTFTDVSAPATKIGFNVTGASVVDGTGYRKVTVTHSFGTTLFTASRRLAVQFNRTGNKGTDGNVTGPGVSVDSEIALFSGTSGTTLKRATGTGVVKITSGVLGTAAAGTDYAAPGANTDITSVLLNQTGLVVKGGSANALTIKPNETLTAGRTLNVVVNDANRTVSLSGDLTVSGAHTAPAGTSAVLSGGQTITGGFTNTSYSIGSVTGSNQTITPTLSNSNIQHCTLNGSSLTGTLTFDVPSGVGVAYVEVVNGGSGSVGATLSTSGYTKVDGTYATTNGNKYLFCAVRTNTYKYLNIIALQ